MKPEIFIRTDGNTKIGLGHVMRSLALAQMLKDEFKITFFCQSIPETIAHTLEKNGFTLKMISDESSFITSVSEDTMVVLDGYQFDSQYQIDVKSKNAPLVFIDDLHDKVFYADLIINHAPSVTPQQYCAQVYTHYALGLHFALLRPPFLAEAKRVRDISKIHSITICFGGSDYYNLTERALDVVRRHSIFKKINVVTGPMYAHHESLKLVIGTDSRITSYANIESDKMLELFLTSESVIAPASGILLEAIAAGNCVISGMYVENQKIVYQAFKKDGLFIDAGTFLEEEIDMAIEKAIANPMGVRKQIDGYSDKRLLKRFRQLSIIKRLSLRKVDKNDLAITYHWATHDQIRAFSFNKTRISWGEHINWFERKLHDENCIYYIVELDRETIGAVRFDVEKEDAIISYLIDHKFHSSGFGLPVLSKSVQSLATDLTLRKIKAKNVVGYVMESNYPSIKTFLNLGFKKYVQEGKLKFVKSIYGNLN